MLNQTDGLPVHPLNIDVLELGFSVETVYFYSAAIGGALVVLQAITSLIGLGGDELDGLDAIDMDVDVDVDFDVDLDTDVDVPGGIGDAWFVGMLSTRAILAGLAVFGLTGLSLRNQLVPFQTMLAALAAAFATMFAVGFVIRSMHKLVADGTVRIEDALGQPGTVYLSLAGNRESVGKVTVRVGERTMEYPAVTSGEKLATGTPVIVVRVLGDMLEVAHVRETEYDLMHAASM
ncbi:MAG: hypothetical protein AB8G99_15160 [Planctomycetaceae bacterium]